MTNQPPAAPPPLSPDHLPDAPAEIRLLLVTHAEGLQNRYAELVRSPQDAVEGGLTAVGWEQANLLAQWLAQHERIDAIYAAPMLRSRLTAQRLGQVLNLPVTLQEGLPGALPAGAQIPDAWNPAVHSIIQPPGKTLSDPQSPYGVYLAQLVEALDSIVGDQWGKTVVVVLSGNGVATSVRYFAGAQVLPVAVAHTGITELRRADGSWYLIYVNRREHIPVSVSPTVPVRSESVAPASGGEHSTDLAAVTRTYNRSQLASATMANAERDQRLRHLLKFVQLKPDLAVLDVGAGAGYLALMLAEDGAREVIGVDISPVVLEAAEYLRLRSTAASAKRVSYRLAPAHALPFRDDRFDAVILRLVLLHSHRPQDILAEMARVLKRGGVLVLADLLSADDPVRRATQNAIEARRNPSHVAAYSADQYRKLVAGAGLTSEAEQVVTFPRELEEWLSDLQADPAVRTTVRDMIEAGLETDAAGLNAQRRGDKIFFDQRIFYLKARKP